MSMNIERVNRDQHATPIAALPPPAVSSGQKLTASSDVLNYNDILSTMETDKGPVEEEEPQQEYYPMEPQYEPPMRPMTVADVPSPAPRVVESPSLLAQYKYPLFVTVLVGLLLFFLVPRLEKWLPAAFSEGQLNVIGIALISALTGVTFEIGDRFVLSKC